LLAKYKTDTIVGTGPYKLVSYKEKQSLEFQANPSYWGNRPKAGRILVRLFDKSSALKLALQNHEVDIAFRSLQPDELASFRTASGFTVVEGQGPGIRYLVFNVNTAPWNNPNMRKALAAALDRTPVVNEVLKGTGKALDSMIPPTFPTHDPAWTSLYGNGGDTAKVNAFLTAAGVPAGQKVNVDFWFSPTHYGDTEASVAQVIARTLEATGRFSVKISSVEWAEYGQKRKAGEMPVFLMAGSPTTLTRMTTWRRSPTRRSSTRRNGTIPRCCRSSQRRPASSTPPSAPRSSSRPRATWRTRRPTSRSSRSRSSPRRATGSRASCSTPSRSSWYWLLDKKG